MLGPEGAKSDDHPAAAPGFSQRGPYPGQSSDSGRCAYKAVPIAQVVYQTGQPGADTLAWEVKYQNKTLGIRRYSATVNVAPAP